MVLPRTSKFLLLCSISNDSIPSLTWYFLYYINFTASARHRNTLQAPKSLRGAGPQRDVGVYAADQCTRRIRARQPATPDFLDSRFHLPKNSSARPIDILSDFIVFQEHPRASYVRRSSSRHLVYTVYDRGAGRSNDGSRLIFFATLKVGQTAQRSL